MRVLKSLGHKDVKLGTFRFDYEYESLPFGRGSRVTSRGSRVEGRNILHNYF